MATTSKFIKKQGGFVRPNSEFSSAPLGSQQRSADLISASRNLVPGQQIPQNTQTPPVAQTPQAPQALQSTNPFETGDYSQITDPKDAFNILTFDLLKRAQGVDNTKLLERKRALERAVMGEVDNSDVSSIKTLSPEQQSAIRSGNIAALRPDIDKNAADLAKAESAIENFERVYQQAQAFGQEYADKVVAPESVVASYKKAIEANPNVLSIILAGVNEKTKNAIIQSLDYGKLSTTGGKTEEELRKEIADNNLKYGDAYTKDEKVQQFQTTDGAYSRINSLADKRNDETYKRIASNNAELQAVVNNYMRMLNPDIARMADGGDLNSQQSLVNKVNAKIAELSEDANTLPSKVRDVLLASDKLYFSASKDLKKYNEDFKKRVPVTGVTLPSIQSTFQVQTPDGQIFNFPSQEAADQFKREANIQ